MAFSGLHLVQLKIVTATVCVSAQLDICQDMSTSMTVFDCFKPENRGTGKSYLYSELGLYIIIS